MMAGRGGGAVGGLVSSLEIQRRVIGALLIREILTRYGRHNIGFLWLFVEPMMFTIGVTTLWTLVGMHHGSDLPISAFALTGYSTVLLWRNMPARCVGSILPNLSLMYHRNVRPIDVFLARLLLEAAGATISFVALSIVFIALGWIKPPENVLLVIGAWLLTAWFGAALAMFLGALSERTELVEKLWHPISYILFPMSGAAFLVESLPKTMQQVVLFLPMVHGSEMVRDGYFGSKIDAHYDVSYMVVVTLILTLLGLAQERQISRRIVPE